MRLASSFELSYVVDVKQARFSILDSDLEKIFKSLNSSRSNRIHYMEFISALLDKRMKFQEAQVILLYRVKRRVLQLRNIFNKFNPGPDGRISIHSLRLALKGTR